MNRAFVTNCVPQKDIIKLKASQAANNFCKQLITNNCFDQAYSIVPPSYRINVIQDELYTYYSSKKSNKVFTFLSHVLNSFRLARSLRNVDSIWFYNVASTSIFVYVLLRFVYCRKVYVILADHTPGKKKISYQNFLQWLITKSHGIISLSVRTKITHKKLIVIPGIIPHSEIRQEKRELNKNLKFLFSGTLSAVTGFEMALKVFSHVPHAELYVSGNGVFPDEYRQYKNIHFKGFMDYAEYRKLYEDIDICLNFRDPELPENQNNFPSKVLEYFSMNKIVISTMEYPELHDAKYIICDNDEDKLIQRINEILKADVALLYPYMDNTSFLERNITEECWQNAITQIEIHG